MSCADPALTPRYVRGLEAGSGSLLDQRVDEGRRVEGGEVVRSLPQADELHRDAEVVDVTGIVLTKLDGTAKGGIVVAVQRELGVPVKLVGLGEGPDDLAPFSADQFVDALLADES